MLTISCGSKDKLIGVYRAEAESSSPRQAETIVELKANGDGIWKVGDEEVPFSWYLKDGELRVNTKGGGVIVGAIGADVIQMTLPGAKTMSFTKVQ
jgi:hypothetical protein